MEQLDLRQQRCPMALLLAKRHVKALEENATLTILVVDISSKLDIMRFLRQHGCQVDSIDVGKHYSLNVTKGNVLDV